MTAFGRIALVFAALLLGLSIYVHFRIGFWGDQDWELLVARMVIDGKRLYIDHVIVNPPLIIYLYTLPVLLSMSGFLLDFQAMVLLGLLTIAFTLYICGRLIALHPAFNDRSRQLQFLVLLCFLFIFRIPTPFFWDREHIFLVLTFPYMLRWMPSLNSIRLPRRLSVAIGCLAAVGFFIKPHCLIFFAGIQIACLFGKYRAPVLTSIENRIIYVFGTLYLLAILVFTPEYFTIVMPMLLLTYSAITAGSSGLFDSTIIMTLLPTFLMFRTRQKSPYRNDIWYLLWLSPFMFGYALANNGWGYTYQPIITLLIFINGFVLWEFLYLRKERKAQGLGVIQATAGAGLCLLNFAGKAAIVLVYFTTVFSFSCDGDRNCLSYYSQYTNEVKTAPAPHSFGMIGMNYALWTRVSKIAVAPWVTRFAQFWMIPKFLVSDDDFANKHEWLLYYVAGAMADDLNTNKPEVMFVEQSDLIYRLKMAKPVDWVSSFSVFLNFKEAWTHYTLVHTIDNCDKPDPAHAVALEMLKHPHMDNTTNCRYDVYRRIH